MTGTLVGPMPKKSDAQSEKIAAGRFLAEEIRGYVDWWEKEKKEAKAESPQLPGVKIDRQVKKVLSKIASILKNDLDLEIDEGLIVRLAAMENLKKFQDHLQALVEAGG